MRIVKINSEYIDIDDQTAIGITLQAYDIREPGKRKVNISNNFTIPKTSNNLRIMGFADDPQTTLNDVYNEMYIDYWINDEHLLRNAKVRVTEISDRISLYVFQKEDVWDEIKKLSYPDFVAEFLAWLQSEKSYPSQSSPFSGNYASFINGYINTTEGLILPMLFSNMYMYDPEEDGTYYEDITTIRLKYWPDTYDNPVNGGHWCAYMKSIFEFIEYKYDVNLCVNESGITGNIWDDALAEAVYIRLADIDIEFGFTGSSVTSVYFTALETPVFNPYEDIEYCSDKTLYDIVNIFFQHFNIIKDEIDIDGQPAIKLARFDDIVTDADIINFSGGISGVPKFRPIIEGFSQNNYIKFSSIYEEGNSKTNSKLLVCNNKNLEVEQDLFEINAYIPTFVEITGGVVPNLSIEDSFKDFTLMISDGTTTDSIAIKCSQDQAVEESVSYQLQKAALYSLDSEYELINAAIKYPRFYELKKWLTVNDIRSIEFFKQYYIQELNGSYFINKISGFNPERSMEPTTLEIFKISDDVAIDFKDLMYFIDGQENNFVDGSGNKFF